MQNSEKAPTDIQIGIVVSRFNEEITSKLLVGAKERAEELGVFIDVYQVPGAVEIPLTAKRMAETGRFDAIVALGAIVQGDTDHYRYVCEMVSAGCLDVSLVEDLPVIFGVLTTQNEAQALERCGGAHGHKGREAIDAAVETLRTLAEIERPTAHPE